MSILPHAVSATILAALAALAARASRPHRGKSTYCLKPWNPLDMMGWVVSVGSNSEATWEHALWSS
jgi:hypothetical protein